MTRDIYARIRDDDMVSLRTDGAISYDSRLEKLIDPDVLEQLLTVIGDHIGDGADGEEIEWAGVAGRLHKMGWL